MNEALNPDPHASASDDEARQAAVRQTAVAALPCCAAILDETGKVLATNARWLDFTQHHAFPTPTTGCGANYIEQCQAVSGGNAHAAGQLAAGILAILSGREKEFSLLYTCQRGEEKSWLQTCASALSGDDMRGVLITHCNVTENIVEEQQLAHLAHFDSLTGLPNRLQFRDRLRQEISQAQRNKHRLALLTINIDRFKSINDSLGHHAGDTLLQQTARRIAHCLRGSDTVGRLGGDEFAVILPDPEGEHGVLTAVRRLVDGLAQPMQVEQRELFVTASIGISLFPNDSSDQEVLMHNAASAMYRAKELGRDNYQFYATAMNDRVKEELRLETDLRHAVQRQEFEIYYQPKVLSQTGAITGFEALLRWNHPTRGLVEPKDFITPLEESRLIIPVGAWVLREACRQVASWHNNGLGTPTLAINISARQLQSQNFYEQILAVLDGSGLPASALELELTESMLMKNPDATIATLKQLKALGIRISLDDFGTGYSSLSYLKRFPLDTVKVDRAFVQDITADPDDISITRAVITMAHHLRLQVVAEGVETEGQLSLLIANHCDYIQGFFFSPPLTASAAESLLREGRTLSPHLLREQSHARTLLLVDDEANILTSLKRLLRRDGYTILTADSGLAGLELLARNSVDVIISDQRMPGMTGVEFLRRAKEIHPETIRMVLSGYTELQSVTDAINEGAIYKFLTKPWDDIQLRTNIEEAFRRKEMADENRRLSHEVQTANDDLAKANERLHTLLDKQQEELTLGHTTLNILQEVFEQIPWPLIGIDDSGMIAGTNSAAETLFDHGGGLLATFAASSLPIELNGILLRGENSGTPDRLQFSGKSYIVHCHTMGDHSASRGKLLLLLPEE
jgi:diguanylate cyclase (GGDEF)-like protein